MGQIGEKEKQRTITRGVPADPWRKAPIVEPVKVPEQVPVPLRRST